MALDVVAMSAGPMSDLTLRWVVTVLFGASIAIYLYILVAQGRRWTNAVNHLLHLAMSVAMIVMVWGIGMNLPTVATMTFFVLAGLWFARAAAGTSTATGEQFINGYYAVMAAAMAWMFAVMNGDLDGQVVHSFDHAPSGAPAMDMSEMAMTTPRAFLPRGSGGEWITAVNWVATLSFAVVALYWACHYLAWRRTDPAPSILRPAHLAPVYQCCTAAGTALMFGALL